MSKTGTKTKELAAGALALFQAPLHGSGQHPHFAPQEPPPHAPVERVEALFPVKCSGVCDVSGPFSSFTGPALSSVMRVWERAKSKRGDGPTQSPIMWKETYKCMCVCVCIQANSQTRTHTFWAGDLEPHQRTHLPAGGLHKPTIHRQQCATGRGGGAGCGGSSQ